MHAVIVFHIYKYKTMKVLTLLFGWFGKKKKGFTVFMFALVFGQKSFGTSTNLLHPPRILRR